MINHHMMSEKRKVKDVVREVKEKVSEIVREGDETRREIQYLLHSLKITPIRNILWDEIRFRRPVLRLRRIIRGEE